ncbi:MAG: M20/M25/M40 family metallo-hydrolase [Gemmatimonadetes bacterium]|nr:M20/M25/M40 family metallo-hydrolase [Gemmatimonadota bacterium]
MTRSGRTVAVPLALLAVVLSARRAPAQQELTREERRIADYVDAHHEEAVALLERMVNINSGTSNPQGVRMVADVLAAELRPLGFAVRLVPMDSVQRGPHLIAERRGSRGKRLLLIGHLDTVFEMDNPFQRFERMGEVAHGPGVEDMKGGDVAIVYALKALHGARALDGAAITVVFTGDEEAPGRPLGTSRRDLIEAGKRSDIALGFEAGSRDQHGEYAVVARRSSSQWTLRVTGTPAHSSRVFGAHVGAGAIYETARILNGFYSTLAGEENLTFNPGVIVGGTEITFDEAAAAGTAFGKTNVVAEHARVEGDIRTLTDEQLRHTRQRMRDVVATSLPGTKAEIDFRDSYPSMSPTDANKALLSLYDDVSRDLGYGPVLPHDPARRGAADVSFVAPYVPGLDGLGPQGSGGHTVEERIELSSLARATKRAALMIYRLTREKPVL